MDKEDNDATLEVTTLEVLPLAQDTESGEPAGGIDVDGGQKLNALRVEGEEGVIYRVYRRRWIGLFVILVLNIVLAMNWILFSAITINTANYFNISTTKVNWLGNIVAAMYVLVAWWAPWMIEKFSISGVTYVTSACLLLGAWLRYAATSSSVLPNPAGSYGLLFVGSVLIGVGQCLIQCVPVAWSEIWMSPRTRTTSTALMAISNPFGGAVASFLAPAIVSQPSDVKTLLLVVGIVSSVTAPLCFAVLPKPPTPPSFSASYKRESFLKALRLLFSSKPKEAGGRESTSGIRERVDFLVIFVAFSILVAAFDAFATLLDQIFSPYGYDSDQSGYFGAVLILSGIVAAIVSAPIFDRLFFKHLALAGKILAPISAISYLGLIFAIKENDMAGIYFLMVFLGVSSFILLPVALELSAEVTFEIMRPEMSTSLLYMGANGMTTVLVVVMDALEAGNDDPHPLNMKRGLIFVAVISLASACGMIFLNGRPARRERDDDAATKADRGA